MVVGWRDGGVVGGGRGGGRDGEQQLVLVLRGESGGGGRPVMGALGFFRRFCVEIESC